MAETGKIGYSICVCTYNRALVLKLCLEALKGLKFPPDEIELEIIVVDNNSSDATPDEVHAASEASPIPIRYLFEARQGLSYARNAAVEATSKDYVAFIDDECVVPEDWIRAADRVIRQHSPTFLGGPYYALFLPGERPGWFKEEYGNAYFLTWNMESGFKNCFFASGGNFFVRRDVFDHCRFDPDMGMTGTRIGYGEETLLQQAFRKTFPDTKTYYEKDLWLSHIVLPHKMSIRNKLRRDYHVGRAQALAAKIGVSELILSWKTAGRALGHTVFLPILLQRRDRRLYPSWKNYVYEEYSVQVMRELGRISVGRISSH